MPLPFPNRRAQPPDPPPLHNLAKATAAAARRVSLAALSSPRREKARIAHARQIAAYLQHVALGSSLSACAVLFARDRATIRHACARVEDARDDARFDAAVLRLEDALKAQRRMFCDFSSAFTAQCDGEFNA
jgi:hypothetical protein